MSDLISREDAINAIYHHFTSMTMGECENVLHEVPSAEVTLCHLDSPCDYQNADIAVPSAGPERKVEKWIIRDNPGTGWFRVTCSECGEDVTSTIPMIGFFPNAKPLWDYCYRCGADMRGEEDEDSTNDLDGE